jgi:hypothetical protein
LLFLLQSVRHPAQKHQTLVILGTNIKILEVSGNVCCNYTYLTIQHNFSVRLEQRSTQCINVTYSQAYFRALEVKYRCSEISLPLIVSYVFQLIALISARLYFSKTFCKLQSHIKCHYFVFTIYNFEWVPKQLFKTRGKVSYLVILICFKTRREVLR